MVLNLILVAMISAVIAGQINHGIYRLAWNPRPLSPWSPAPGGTSPRTWIDRIPIIGWWYLRRESSIHGHTFWVRPFLLEIGFVMGMVFLYIFEMNKGLLPMGALGVNDRILQWQFVGHFVLISLMMVATFIDIDEKTIPDTITVTGTLFGFALATAVPESLLYVWKPAYVPGPVDVVPNWIVQPWHPILNGPQGLVLGIACLAAWTYALQPKTLWYRGGGTKFIRYLVASIRRSRMTKWYVGLFLVTSGFTFLIWRAGGMSWQGLLTALVGMAASGAVVWLIRIVASPILQQEAMGFGDVTLMGMIGAYLGWQGGLIVFFFSPFAGCLIAITQWLLTRSKQIAFGPFLCSSALFVIVCWAGIWDRWGLILFQNGWLIPIVFLIGLFLLAGMLLVWQKIKQLMFASGRLQNS